MTATASVPTRPRLGADFPPLFRAETYGELSRTSFWVTGVCAVLAGMVVTGISSLGLGFLGTEGAVPTDVAYVVAAIPTAGTPIIATILMLRAGSLVTRDYTTGAIFGTFTLMPRRPVVVLTKTAIAALSGLVLGILSGLGGLLVLGLAQSIGNWPPVDVALVLLAILRLGAGCALVNMFAIGIALSLRSPVITTLTIVALYWALPIIAATISTISGWPWIDTISQAIPSELLSNATRPTPIGATIPWLSLLGLAAWAALSTAIGLWRIGRQ